MTDNSNNPNGINTPQDPLPEVETTSTPDPRSAAERFWDRIIHIGLGETTLRVGTGIVSVALVVLVVWVMSNFVLKNQVLPTEEPQPTDSVAEVTAVPLTINIDSATKKDVLYSGFGISRLALMHTDRPAAVRSEIIEYTVQSGDSVTLIAEKFGLTPQTIMWSNFDKLADNPHQIFPGDVFRIPPINGAFYTWSQNDGLNGVSTPFNVTPEVIIDWPSNNLDRATLGDFALPNIPVGTVLFIPGGVREFTDWLPVFTREKPAQSSISGSACGILTEGYMGSGTYVWPTTETWLSGYDYSPETNHRAIDIDGSIGNPVYAVDAGVIVYAGWNDRGYGNLIVVDHGRGWQSVYAHLSDFAKTCGDNVEQGEQIGYLGSTGNSTGPHLHFELRSETYGVVNPWDFLQQ